MTAISMMGFIVEERIRKELSSTTPRGWTLSCTHDLHPVRFSHFINVFARKRNP